MADPRSPQDRRYERLFMVRQFAKDLNTRIARLSALDSEESALTKKWREVYSHIVALHDSAQHDFEQSEAA